MALHKFLIETKKIKFFSLNVVYELYNDNKPCACKHKLLPLLIGDSEPESKKIGFVTPIFESSEISKTINVNVI